MEHLIIPWRDLNCSKANYNHCLWGHTFDSIFMRAHWLIELGRQNVDNKIYECINKLLANLINIFTSLSKVYLIKASHLREIFIKL